MAKINNNLLLAGLTGKIGATLVVQKNGVVRSRPKKSDKPRSIEQKKNSARFKMALKYYHSVIADPELLAKYKKAGKKGQRMYNRIISEFMLAE